MPLQRLHYHLMHNSFLSLWDTLTSAKLNHIYWAIEDNKLDLTMMNEIIVDVVGREYVELYNYMTYSWPKEILLCFWIRCHQP